MNFIIFVYHIKIFTNLLFSAYKLSCMLTIKYIIWYLILEPAVSSCTGGCHTAPMAGLHSLHCANWHWLEAVPFNVWWPLCIISCSVAGIAVTGFLATTILNKTWITSYLFVQTPYFSFIHNWPYWVHDIFMSMVYKELLLHMTLCVSLPDVNQKLRKRCNRMFDLMTFA